MIATTSILADVTREIAGDCASVETIVPAGADPHEFEPSAREAASLRGADLVLAFGLGLERSLEPILDDAADEGTTVVEVSPHLEPIRFGSGDGEDPHVWQDPVRMATAAGVIADALADHTDCVRADVEHRAEQYADDLHALNDDIAARVDTIPVNRRTLVTNHDSLGYFADRYGFEIAGTVIPGGSTLGEPSSADLADLAELIRSTGVPAIFAETLASTDVADALAAEVGRDVQVVALLVSGLLIAPPAAASLVTRRVPALMAVAAGLGVASVTIGLILSYHLDTAAGATAAAVAVGMFFVAAAVTGLARWFAQRRTGTTQHA